MSEEELKEHNATILEQMDSAAAAVVTAALRSLARTKTRIKLRDPDGHSVGYDLVGDGNPDDVEACALANGVESVADGKLVVAG